jgi:flagellar M-ring protein FliF
MDFTRTEQTREFYDPNANVVRSQQDTMQETTDGRARGIPGATSNQPPPTPQLSATASSATTGTDSARNRSSTSLRNFEVSREVKSTRPALGEVKRLSVAVLVRSATTMDENGKPVEKPLSDTERQHFTELLQEAVGFDANRGDKVSIVSSSFADAIPMSARSWYDAPWLEDAIKQIVILLILAIIVLGALKPFLTRLMTGAEYTIGQDDPMLGEGESIEVREGETLEDIKARLKPKKAAISAELLDTANTYDDKVTLIRMLVGDDSGRVTQVLKSLIQRDLA